jgi:glycosyltransferase involved in cell wall biosynthesis
VEAVEGGVALHLRYLVAEQLRRGHQAAIALPPTRSWGATDRRVAADLAAAGAETFEVPLRRNPAHPANAVAAGRLYRLVRRWRPDVVHSHATIAGAVARPLARLAGVPAVHTQHGVRFADPDGGASARAGRALERALAPATSVAIAVSESEGDVLRQVHRPDRVLVVPNGIPLAPPRARPPQVPRVVSVGRFTYPKDPVTAIRVLAEVRRRLPAVEALVVGYGDGSADVRRLVAEVDPGIDVRDDVPGPEAIAGATAMLLCTRREGGPYVVLEAMERGLPVVANDVVGCRDVVDGSVGGLFPVGDVAAGAALLERILGDATVAALLGAGARRRVEAHHTVEAMAEGVEGAYAAALA